MRRILLTLLPASILAIASAHAASAPPSLERIVKSARAQVVIPTDWDGIWTTQDSIYSCVPVFELASTGADTLCGGKDYTATSQNDIAFTCTGTSDATTFNVHCTGSGEVFPGCVGDFDVHTNGTRTGDTYFTVSTVNITFTGDSCLGTSSCTQINTHGTRSGPTTPADCAVTPTRRPSWGQLKVIYR